LYQTSANARAHQRELAGWRSAGSAPWHFVLKQGDNRFQVELDVIQAGSQPQLQVRVGETTVELKLLASDGRWLSLEQDGVRRRVAYHQQGDSLWLYGQYGNLELQDVTHEAAGGQSIARSGTVRAPM